MMDFNVRVFPVENGKISAIAYYMGEEFIGEGDSAGQALIELGLYIKRLQQRSDNETLMRLVLEGTTDEIRDCRKGIFSKHRNPLSKNSNNRSGETLRETTPDRIILDDL